MSYKYSKGSTVQGDIKAADDSDRDTIIDFGEDRIDLQTNGSTRLKISGSQGQVTFNEEYTFPHSDGNRDQVLTTDGDGSVSWATPAGSGGATLVLMAHLSSDFNVTTSDTNEYLTVPFNSVLKTTFAGSDFNTSNYTFTAPEEGFYFLNCSLYHTSISATPTQYQVRISSSADWGYAGAIAFRNFFPGAMAETTVHTHRLDRIAHLSGSDEVKITIRPVAAAGSYGKIVGLPHVSYLTIHKLS